MAALGLEVEGAAAAAVILGREGRVVVMGQLIITPESVDEGEDKSVICTARSRPVDLEGSAR